MALNTNHEILIADAATMQANFIAPTSPFRLELKGGFFFREGIDAILAQDNCIGLRYYFTYNDDDGDGQDELKVIMLGVESESYYDLFNGIIIGNAQTEPNDCTIISAVSQQISLDNAVLLTDAFVTKYPGAEIGGFFFRSIIDYFLGVGDVIGLRYKFGINENGDLKLILNPVDRNFCDMDIYNANGQKIKAELSNGGGDGNPNNPLTY